MNMKTSSGVPASTSMERDGDGRLLALVVSGRRPLTEGSSWLLAVDGSDHGQRAVAEAIALALEMKACVLHVLNVQPWLSKEAAETELAQRGWELSAKARAALDASELPWELHVAMGDAAERIVELAVRLRCRGIVIGSRGLGAAENLLLGSVAYKVIHLSPISVLVVR